MDSVAFALAEHDEPIAGTRTFWRSAAPRSAEVSPILYVHGVPTCADDWTPFLRRTGGVALDLPGFGRSAKPSDFNYSIVGYDEYLDAFISRQGWSRFSLVVHDWGGLALVTALRLRERVDRLVIINSVPLLPGYRWHRIARGWRTPLLGELMMGLMTRTLARWISRESRPSREPWPEPMLDAVWRHFDHGTRRAILRLYRSAPSSLLERSGRDLGRIDAPTLVLWGERDPYIPAAFAAAFAELLPNATLELLPDAGHWPWLDRPDVVETAGRFLCAPPGADEARTANPASPAAGARHTGE